MALVRSARPRTFLLSGATGFLGKVVIEELVRRRGELSLERIVLVIRPTRGRSAEQRFHREIVSSECFRQLPADWPDLVSVLEGDVSVSGVVSADESEVLDRVTHLVHAAASVKFHLPLPVAARANVTGTLNMLQLAQRLPGLERLVHVSTAYAAPASDGGPIKEAPVTLPLSAEELYQACLSANGSEHHLLARAGHPNSYTLTKAIGEQLLLERRGAVPLTILRPSVITAARRYPFPAWIDSSAGFAAFVTLVGLGHMRALACDPDARLDLVPVDEVSHRLILTAITDSSPVSIRHAVVGKDKSPTVSECWHRTQAFFSRYPVDERPRGRTLRPPRDPRFLFADAVRHRLPAAAARLRSKDRARRAEKRLTRVANLNTDFAYFTTRSFDFESSLPIDDGFSGSQCIDAVDQGVHRYLLGQDHAAWPLVARGRPRADLRWALGQPNGSAWIRGAAWLSAKVLRRATERITVDVPSFRRAREAVPPAARLVLTPSHRSYLDFVLCSYLAFARPDLLPIPYVAATEEFARIPVLGRALKALQAFFVKRGGIDRTLPGRVTALVQSEKTFSFFIEGARSRTGEFLPPKRGLLRCLQAAGGSYALLPIAISYQRVPEQAAFERELAGQPKPPMRVGPLVDWIGQALRGKIDLGRIHIACGAPVILTADSDARVAADAVIAELRRAMLSA